MKTAIFSLLAAIVLFIFGIFQFERWENLNLKILELEKNIQILKEKESEQKEQKQELKETFIQQNNSFSEIVSLIELSAIQLQVARDVKAALTLLNLVDTKILLTQDPKLSPLREAIVRDKVSLGNILLPDVTGIWFKVGALMGLVDNLPLKWVKTDYQQVETVEENQSSESMNWQQVFKNSLNEFKDLIKIQRHNKPIEPLLSQAEFALAREHLKLFLEQIRWAALHQDSKIYVGSIREAEQWVNRYFETENTQVQTIQNGLSELSKITLNVDLPTLETVQQLKIIR